MASGGRNRPAGCDGRAYVDTCEAAARLGLSSRTLDRYRASGAAPVFHRFGGRVRCWREDLEAWAASQRQVPSRTRAGAS